MTTLPEIIGALVSDAFELSGTHGGSVAGAVIGRYFRRRGEQARNILFEELRRANISDAQAASEDDAIAVIARYLRAAREGAARLNLRLLAKAIAGKLRAGALVADEFLQYAEALASLSRDEIIVIGTIYKLWSDHQSVPIPNPSEAANIWSQTVQQLTTGGMSTELVVTAAARAQRSGLIYGLSAPTGILHGTEFAGNTVYRISPLLLDLGKTVDFEDALWQERSDKEGSTG
jgi:hypothetical protein